MNQPLISIIIPFLNGGSWLAEAIDSVISQVYANWELIIIDDGSEQVHSNVARQYSSQHLDKIFYHDHPGHINRGVTASRNLGLSLCKGTLIALLDSDDCWLPGKLQQQFELFDHHPEAGMICEASKFWHSWNDPSLEDVVVNVGVEPNKLYDSPELMYSLYPLGKVPHLALQELFSGKKF